MCVQCPLWYNIELRWKEGEKSGYGWLSWHGSILVQNPEKLKKSMFNLDSSLRFFEELKRRMPLSVETGGVLWTGVACLELDGVSRYFMAYDIWASICTLAPVLQMLG